MKFRLQSGFTITELLIVIVVIGILATIVTVTYSGLTVRAQAAKVVSALEEVDTALHTFAINSGTETWWRDTVFTGANNPNLSAIIDNSDLKNYLSAPPGQDLGLNWTYDNDGDTRNPSTCDTNGWTGVVFAITGMSLRLMQEVDKSMDDGNPQCGKVRIYNTSQGMLYQLSYNQSMLSP